MSVDDAREYLGRAAKDLDDDGLRMVSAYAMTTGVTVLAKIAKEGRRSSSKEMHSGEGVDASQAKETYESTDLEAAKTLLKFAIDARKLLLASKAPAKTGNPALGKDLFDSGSPWSFKEED